MARAHFVKAARQDNPVVKKGESYWWWKFAYGAKQYSKDKPSRSQLTRSYFLGELYNIQDSIEAMTEPETEDIVVAINELREQCEDSLENMPEHLRETSQSGETLQERIDALEAWVNELEAIDVDPEELEGAEYEEWKAEVLEEIKACDSGL